MKRPPIHPVVWTPPPMPARARSKASTPPAPVPRLIPLGTTGPEDVAVDDQGRMYTGVEDGRILRLTEDGGRIETIAETGGHPLGVELSGDGRLIVCDWQRGLLRIDPVRGTVETLVEEVDGERLRFCNNSSIAQDGTIYFSDSSRRFGQDHYEADFLEHSGTGRLLRRGPAGDVSVLLDGLQFANGVALAPDESFVVVAETAGYRLTRLWLTGEHAGLSDVLVANLPGFPDNISTGSGGRIWVALASPRNRLLDWLHPRAPVLRRAAWAMPDRLRPKPKRTMWAMAFDLEGRLVRDLQRRGDSYHFVTGVRELGGKLYLGSIEEAAIAVLDLDER